MTAFVVVVCLVALSLGAVAAGVVMLRRIRRQREMESRRVALEAFFRRQWRSKHLGHRGNDA